MNHKNIDNEKERNRREWKAYSVNRIVLSVTRAMMSTSSTHMPTAKAMASKKLSSTYRMYPQKERRAVAPPKLKHRKKWLFVGWSLAPQCGHVIS